MVYRKLPQWALISKIQNMLGLGIQLPSGVLKLGMSRQISINCNCNYLLRHSIFAA